MKTKLFTLFILLCTGNVFAQFAQSEGEKLINKKKTGDDKANFSSIFNGLGKFTSQDEATITFQPTLYGLASLFNPKIKEQDKFVRATFLRNFQLNLGITPNDESIFEIDDFQSGFSYAILNNKKLTKADYDHLIAKFGEQRKLFVAALNQFIVTNNTAAGEEAKKYTVNPLTDKDVANMDVGLKVFLKNKMSVSTDAELVAVSAGLTTAFKNLTTELSKRTLLKIDFKSTYSFADKQWGELSFTPVNLYYYFNKKKLSSPGLNATIKYVLGTDTITKEALKRSMIETELGMNFPIKVNPDTEKARLEIKPGISFKYIGQRLYKDENRSKFDPTLTFRIRINDDFYLPLKLEYNTDDAELFGFLSIQFSLN